MSTGLAYAFLRRLRDPTRPDHPRPSQYERTGRSMDGRAEPPPEAGHLGRRGASGAPPRRRKSVVPVMGTRKGARSGAERRKQGLVSPMHGLNVRAGMVLALLAIIAVAGGAGVRPI